jgi:hypothetical protein
VTDNLLRGGEGREALVLAGPDAARRAWSRGVLRAEGLPSPVAGAIAKLDWLGLLRLAAGHLFGRDTRPDDRLLWPGDPADPWPYGAWLVGAAVILPGGGDPAAITAQEGATILSPADSGWFRPPV